MSCDKPTCTVYYNTKSSSDSMHDKNEDNVSIWIGIKKDMKLKLSCWYKGAANEISIFNLDNDGKIKLNDYMNNNKFSNEWTKKEMIFNVQKESKAFKIAIIVGNTKGGYLLIDDIELEVLEGL